MQQGSAFDSPRGDSGIYLPKMKKMRSADKPTRAGLVTGLCVLWVVVNVFLVAFVWVSFHLARKYVVECSPAEGKLCFKNRRSTSFSAVWGSLLSVCIATVGILVLNKHRTFLNMGFMAGAAAMLGNWSLVSAVEYANLYFDSSDRMVGNTTSENDGGVGEQFFNDTVAAAIIAAMCTLFLGIFSVILLYHVKELVNGIRSTPSESIEDVDDDASSATPRSRTVGFASPSDGRVKLLRRPSGSLQANPHAHQAAALSFGNQVDGKQAPAEISMRDVSVTVT